VSGRRRATLWIAGCVALCALHARARADDAAGAVRVLIPDCLGVSGADVRALIALELAPRLRVVSAGEAPAALTATVTCGPGPVRLTVDDAARAAELRVDLDLAAAAPQARARVLAVSVAELIATSRLERAAPADADVEPDAANEDAAPIATPIRLWLAPGLSRAGAPATTLFGFDLGISHELAILALLGDVQARFGRAGVTDAEVAVQTFSVGLACAALLARGAFQLTLGPGVRTGHVALSARAERADLSGDELTGLWLGPMAVAAAELTVLGTGALRLAVEAGYVARPVRGLDQHDRDLFGLHGPWLSATLGVALGLP
jgi:hypothetical protein